MQVSDFAITERSHLRQSLEGYLTYFPPPTPRALQYDPALVGALSEADRALGELSGVGQRLRNPQMLIRPYMRREAVLSSRIEGTQSSLAQLLLFEANAPTVSPEDAREVLNYVHALEWGLLELKRLPISQRLILGLHRRLLEGVRGHRSTPGRFRTTQNWIGPQGTPLERAIFVPPPPEILAAVLDDLERYIHEQDTTPPLLRCALIHYQFETIHPFVDGNGRLGRLLMPLFLIERDCLSQPLLYLSAFFERRRDQYYTALMTARATGDIQPWLLLFLEAVLSQAKDAAARADRLTALEADFRGRLRGTRSKVAHALVDEVFGGLFLTASGVARRQNVTALSARAAIDQLVSAGILREMTGRSYGRVYSAPEVLAILDTERAQPRRNVRPKGRTHRGPR
jgi:Fic family protein